MPGSRSIVALRLLGAGILVAVATPTGAAPLAPPFDLYEVGPAEERAFATAAADPGEWISLRQETAGGRRWVLLALPDGRAGGSLPGLGRPRYLGRVRAGERVVLAAPSGEDGERLRSGRSVTIAPSGASVLVTSESPEELAWRAPHGGFHVLTRSLPLVAPRSPGPPAGLVPILERVRAAEARQGVLRTREEVQQVIDQVDSTSLRRYVEGLSLDGGGTPSSRWWSDLRTEGVKADSIVLWLAAALGPENVRKHQFEYDDGTTVHTVHNVVAKQPSANPDAGAYLVTAHYDAIGVRSDPLDICAAGLRDPGSGCDCGADSSVVAVNPACRWNADTDPAPGADDNATGVAAMVEAARVLAGVDFDFDIYYVAFQTEELGLIGSAAFADSIASDAIAQDVFAVLNMDMLGYNQAGDQIDVLTNEPSEWFADWIVETADDFFSDFPATKIVTGFGRSDHASFWGVGIDGIHLFEDDDLLYPQYHRFQDLWESTFPPPPEGRENSEMQFLRATQLAVATLARFALHYEAPDLAIPPGAVSGRPGLGFRLEAGRDVVLQARVHNFGTSELVFQGTTVDSLTARVRFWDGDPDAGGTLVGEQTRRAFFASGGVVPFEVIWPTAVGQEGFHEIHAVVEGLDPGYPQIEIDRDNNRASYELFLRGSADAGPRILEQYPYPNPVRGDVSRLNFYYELTTDARVVIEIFDLEGTRLGYFSDGDRPDSDAGPNRIGGHAFVDNGGEAQLSLQSGVYAYVMHVSRGAGSDEVTDRKKGKFALVR